MSLTAFIKRPRISKAFDEFALKERTPPAFKKLPRLVPDHGGPNGLAGSAFDYLARLKIARTFGKTDIDLNQGKWISEQVREWFDTGECETRGIAVANDDMWASCLDRAHNAATAYMHGDGCLSCLAVKIQYMAHADLMLRNPNVFDEFFQPSLNVAQELEALIEIFDPKIRFDPNRSIVLNPSFPKGQNIGGADGDLIIDNRLIDFKTSAQLSISKAHLIQLAGYKVLSDLGGIETADGTSTSTLDSLGIYFSRYDVLFELDIDEMFPIKGYEKFKAVFVDEFLEIENRILERKRERDELFSRAKRVTKASSDH